MWKYRVLPVFVILLFLLLFLHFHSLGGEEILKLIFRKFMKILKLYLT